MQFWKGWENKLAVGVELAPGGSGWSRVEGGARIAPGSA